MDSCLKHKGCVSVAQAVEPRIVQANLIRYSPEFSRYLGGSAWLRNGANRRRTGISRVRYGHPSLGRCLNLTSNLLSVKKRLFDPPRRYCIANQVKGLHFALQAAVQGVIGNR